jgi:hypothetical protein
MLNPFSNVPTPFRVSTGGRGYFASCAIDAIGFHPMVDNQDVLISSYCHHCAEPIRIELKNGKMVSASPENPLVYVSIPARKWWDNIVDTCSNNMVFHSKKEHLREWQMHNPSSNGEAISVGKTLELGQLLFKNRLALDFVRPDVVELQKYWDSIGLTNSFWKLK